MAYEWFISYRRKTGGESQAQKVAEILSKYVEKDKIFYDRDSMHEGNDWRDKINDALNTAEHFVLLVNEASATEDQSNNVGGYIYEIETALKLNKKITIIEYDKKSYDDIIAKYPSLKIVQKITLNGEYNFTFEERLCKHFGFAYPIIPNFVKTKNDKYDPNAVYISYAHKPTDTNLVHNLVKIIRQSHIQCYIDEKMEYGEDITDFEEAIGKGRCVILIFSEKYFYSRHCMYEFKNIQKGLDKHIKKLICIKSGKCDLSDHNFIRKLHIHWWGKKGAFEYDKNSCTPLPIDKKANENDFYISDIKDFYSFFNKNLYTSDNSIDYDKLIQEIATVITPLYNSDTNNEINGNDNLTEEDLNKKINYISEDLKKLSKELYEFATLKENMGDFNTSEIYYKKALKLMRCLQNSQENSIDLIKALNNFARFEQELSDINSAKKHYQEALSIMRDLPKTIENLSMYAIALNNYAVFEKNIGNTKSAKKHFEKSLEITRMQTETPQVLDRLATTLNHLADLKINLGDTDSAKKDYEEALNIYMKLSEQPQYLYNLANTLNNIANLEKYLNETVSAKNHFEKSVEIYRKLPETPQDLRCLLTTLGFLAMLEEDLSDIDSAQKHYEEGLKIARQINDEEYIKFFEIRLSNL